MTGFEEVYLVEQRRAYQLAYLLCGNTTVAEDVVAEAFARVWPRWNDGEVTDVGAYIRRAVVNQVISGHRRRGLERRERARRRTKDEPAGPEDLTVNHRVVLQALMGLPPKQRAAIVLRYFEDLTESDIARAMGSSVGTTKSHLSRGLATLRRHLDDGQEQRA